jgi:hypothetical protein
MARANKPKGMADTIDRNWTVPPELFRPIYHIAAKGGYAWEQIAVAALYNGLTDMAIQSGDEGVVNQLRDAMESLIETSLRDFYVMAEAWQQVDSMCVHTPGMERLARV